MNWKKRSEHPDYFEDGDSMLVAVAVHDEPSKPKCHWEISAITIRCDEDYFSIETMDGDAWGWSWEDVEWWMPIRDVITSLPDPNATESEGE